MDWVYAVSECSFRAYIGDDHLPLFFCDLPAAHEGEHRNQLLEKMWPRLGVLSDLVDEVNRVFDNINEDGSGPHE